jgi:pyridoxal/pyridoxine/pyridoxamine kinase
MICCRKQDSHLVAFSFHNRLFCLISPCFDQITPNHVQIPISIGESHQNKQDINEQLANLLINKQLPQAIVTSLQSTLRENATLKEKNAKLKSLLGRSAKAQRDAKHEL